MTMVASSVGVRMVTPPGQPSSDSRCADNCCSRRRGSDRREETMRLPLAMKVVTSRTGSGSTMACKAGIFTEIDAVEEGEVAGHKERREKRGNSIGEGAVAAV